MVSSTESAITSRLASDDFMPCVAHGDAVGDGDGGEFARRAAGGGDALLDRLRLALQRDVARRRLVPAVATPTNGWWICSLVRPMA